MVDPMRHCIINIPLVPPSVNHYVRHVRGRHVVTKEAKAFKEAVAIFSRESPHWDDTKATYIVGINIWLGKKQRGDIDNFPKLCLDGIRDAGVIHSDAAIKQLYVNLFRDWENPRTQIIVTADL